MNDEIEINSNFPKAVSGLYSVCSPVREQVGTGM